MERKRPSTVTNTAVSNGNAITNVAVIASATNTAKSTPRVGKSAKPKK